MNPRRQFILSGTALALALSLPLSASAAQPAQLGFVYVSPIGDAGWTFQHDQGRKEIQSDNELEAQSSGLAKCAPARFQRQGSEPEVGKRYNLSLDR